MIAILSLLRYFQMNSLYHVQVDSKTRTDIWSEHYQLRKFLCWENFRAELK